MFESKKVKTPYRSYPQEACNRVFHTSDISILCTYILFCVLTDTEQEADFNDNWVRTWKTTHNYRIWKSKAFENIDYIHPGYVNFSLFRTVNIVS